MISKVLSFQLKSSISSPCLFLVRCFHIRRDSGANLPFLEHYRNAWPDTSNILPPNIKEPFIPPRTISDDCLRFTLTSTFDRGSSIHYPHMNTHPSDIKVTLEVYLTYFTYFFSSSSCTYYHRHLYYYYYQVAVRDLPLTSEELPVFLRLVGTRYDGPKQKVRLVVKRFANRIENKRFSVLLLERLLAEARRLTKEGLEYEQQIL